VGRPVITPPHIELSSDEPRARSISQILDCRRVGRRYDYFVDFDGLPMSERSWVPLSDLPTTLNEQLEHFHRRHRCLPRPPRFQFLNLEPKTDVPIHVPADRYDPPRSPSPRPTSTVVQAYKPAMQTTTQSGRVARPPPRVDDILTGARSQGGG